jgi:hypothetical protein
MSSIRLLQIERSKQVSCVGTTFYGLYTFLSVPSSTLTLYLLKEVAWLLREMAPDGGCIISAELRLVWQFGIESELQLLLVHFHSPQQLDAALAS